MAETHILTQTDASQRARLLRVDSYDVAVDLTGSDTTFVSTSTVRFSCTEPGASTFIEIAAEAVTAAQLNGTDVDLSEYSAENGLKLPSLAADNELVVTARCRYSSSGQGLHRMTDPVDKQTYLYSQFEVSDAQQMFACFDQPDLKARFTFRVTLPEHWRAISNMPVDSETTSGETKTVHFEQSPPMSTYVTALCAGPYHEVTDSHDGIGLGLYCRESMKEYLDAEGVFEITKQGFDHFHSAFGVRYPLPKYDQVFAPEYNMGAMENFGCITIAEASFLFRSQVTEYELEQRANVILHEMAHMWFGDLVTMRWWDDLWLNESFAEWASHWANVEATKYSGAWTTFLTVRKNWGYRQDQLPTTHPVYTPMPDVEAVATNFDGITYAKGASILKQLVAYVGIEPFKQGLRQYFEKHQWGNAAFSDLLGCLEASSGRELREFADTWLASAGVSTLSPELQVGPDGTYTSVAIRQEVVAEHPTLRTHRIGVGLYDLDDGVLRRRRRIELDVSGERTEVAELVGEKQPDVLLVNDDDLTYCKTRLDERSMATVVEHIAGFTDSLPRALTWAAAWDMLRDGEMAARDFVRLGVVGLPHERDINVVSMIQRQLGAALVYADPAVTPSLRADLAATAMRAVEDAEPGGDMQRSWAKAYAGFTRGDEGIARLKGWLAGQGVPSGLAVDTDLRWHLLTCLAGLGAASAEDINEELKRDNTADGERLSLIAHASLPTVEAKAETWRRITEDAGLANYARRSLMLGFAHPDQLDLIRPYVSKFLDSVAPMWQRLSTQEAIEYISFAFPRLVVEQDTLDATDAWLANGGDGAEEAAMRRGVLEGRDDIARALRARAKDAQAG
ncbi:aminopeptidase N [Stackebrandtia nassauensis]|uniref:Aminopeptidase N n=1 Tax=Stackebrandtia nassauensis (strain DSM 44728 / CIP 108903 / NRRL B-16338 / NBRC 102104 / LLR-40K-21) TaxID=446470 RepID=D3PVV6_STANL|nr:aminopeptidase N [Stackebrandtia nassauensis]ADD45077.1 aminopeptidase N [Stackebrandtia nassauensis DSM 44728]